MPQGTDTRLATNQQPGQEPSHIAEATAEVPLSQLDVLVIDCQATAAGPRGHLLELGWARVRTTMTEPAQARLIKLPDGEPVPPAVERITGISARMLHDGADAHAAWRELSQQASTLAQQPAPTVVHFARFEAPFLRALAAGEPALDHELPLDIVCTHEIARRLLPDLPRRSLRALTGYFGRAVSALRRSADHVEATAFVWQELVRLLDAKGISTWSALHEWLAADVAADAAAPQRPRQRRRRVWPISRELRLALPDAPGIYRLQRTGGDVLYVGKASSLRSRVNSYFRHQSSVPERMLEMLSQVRALSFDVTPSALEAALLEPDEIKRHRPPYNLALTDDAQPARTRVRMSREVWFASPDLSDRSLYASAHCSVGPFAAAETLDQFASLAEASPAALGRGRWAPTEAIFNAGYAMLCAAHKELTRNNLSPHSRLLRLGTRLWREGRRDRDVDLDEMTNSDGIEPAWTAERVQVELEWLALRAALARRRAKWLTRLVDASLVWSEAGVNGARLIAIENGEVTFRACVDPNTVPPIPPCHGRPIAARHEGFTIARFDRLRVLTTELKRLVSEDAPVALRFGVAPALTGKRLAYALSWL